MHIFLNCFEVFDKEWRVTEEKPTWINSFNFLCLHNLPDMLQKFGQLQNLWEGGGKVKKS